MHISLPGVGVEVEVELAIPANVHKSLYSASQRWNEACVPPPSPHVVSTARLVLYNIRCSHGCSSPSPPRGMGGADDERFMLTKEKQ